MSKHGKKRHQRQHLDLYQTPYAAVRAVFPYLGIQPPARVWEPFNGFGRISRYMSKKGFDVIRTDIGRYRAMQHMQRDFFSVQPGEIEFDHIVTNPPYGLRNKLVVPVVKRALELRPRHGIVAMLLPSGIDHARTRNEIFQDCPYLRMQVKVQGRIEWFKGEYSGMEDHSWFIWGPPAQRQVIAYGSLKQ